MSRVPVVPVLFVGSWGYEKNVTSTQTDEVHYISCGDGLNVIVVKNGTTFSNYYVYTDYLGSILTVTNEARTVMAEQNFDAWGRNRDPNTWNYSTALTAPPAWLYRGYTGHEHLPQFGLINMNGRLYDPVVGRMLSVDNFVSDNMSSQAYNRYTYALNNPLKFTDPDGENPLLVGALIGGTINVIRNWKNIHDFGDGLLYFGVGAIAGALGGGVGAGVGVSFAGGSFAAGFLGTAGGIASTGFISGVASGFASGFTSGFISGVGNGLVGHKGIGESIGAGFTGAFQDGTSAAIFGGVKGGIGALNKNVNFFTGKTKVDLSSGFGAHGLTSLNANMNIRYVGLFEGVNVYEGDLGGGGVTLPGFGIVVGHGALTNGLYPDVLQHEFGHILQSRQVGLLPFYNVIGKESLVSASLHGIEGHNHNTFWTETWANFKADKYFGSRSLLGGTEFPIQNVSTFNLSRVYLGITLPPSFP